MGSTSSPATFMSDKHYYNSKNNNNSNVQLTGSLSPSKSYNSSPSTSSPSSPSPNSSTKGSMEEVWKEISLSSIHDHTTTPTTTSTATGFARFQLQDFMPIRASPSNILSTSPSSRARPRTIIGRDTKGNMNTAAAVSKACPATALRLNSRSGLLGHEVGPRVSCGPPLNHYNSQLFEVLGTSSGFTITCKKKIYENGSHCDDKRHEKLMKSRESAARSRARKQAHTDELEVQLTRLQKENARLRREIQQYLAAPAQLPKKRSLRRTLTAPF